MLKNIKIDYKKLLWVWVLSVLFLSGCGFHPRRSTDIPPQLRVLYVKTQQPYTPLITQLKAMLKSLNIKLAQRNTEAPYTLNITDIAFSQSNPPITTTTLAISFTYSLNVTASITDRDGKDLIPQKNLHASRYISQNASQVYTPGTATLVRQELNRDIISQIYYLLISNNLRRALNHVPQST